MKKLLVAVLVLCLALSMVPAFALELLSGGDTYPIDTDKTITWYAQGGLNTHELSADWKESPFHTGLIRETGINIEWMFPTTGTDGGVYTNTLLADPTKLPDIMQGYFMDSASQYLDEGVIWDLTPYMEEYAPAYYAFLNLLYFGGFIAINLAVMNLLPIPALDGGRVVGVLLTALIEGITKKKLNPRIEGYIHGAGMIALFALMGLIMFKDIFVIIKG